MGNEFNIFTFVRLKNTSYRKAGCILCYLTYIANARPDL